MSKRIVLAAALALAALRAGAQTPPEDGIGVSDGRGYFYSVTNRQGNAAYIQVTKLSLAGAIQWNVSFETQTDAHASAVAVDRDGNLLVGGTLQEGDKKLALVLKYSPYGALLWRQTQDAGGSPMPTVMASDKDSNVYVASTVSDDEGSFVRMLRFNPQGALFWGQNFRAGRSNYPRAVSIDPNGDARTTIDISFGDLSTGIQTKQVVFMTYGAVVPQ